MRMPDPFPNDETTPPVTKINFLSIVNTPHLRASGVYYHCLISFQIFRGINAPRFALNFYDADAETVFQSPELFQPLSRFQRRSFERS